VVLEEDGVHAKTSRGRFHASSVETTRWTLEAEEFGPLFDTPKRMMPMFTSSDLFGDIPPGGITVPLETTEGAHGPKIGLKIKSELPHMLHLKIKGIFKITGGEIDIGTDFNNFYSIEARLDMVFFEVMPASFFFKYEAHGLRGLRRTPGSDKKLILAIGAYGEGDFLLTLSLEAHWTIFVGIAFTDIAKPGEKNSLGFGIIFIVSGSVQYPPGQFALAEVGVKVEGQGLIEDRGGGSQFLILKGSIAIEITIAYLLEIEWEIAEGTVYEKGI
jgi:hypothetical protein